MYIVKSHAFATRASKRGVVMYSTLIIQQERAPCTMDLLSTLVALASSIKEASGRAQGNKE